MIQLESGSLIRTFETLSETKFAVKEILSGEKIPEQITVTVPAGQYSPEDFSFGEEDTSDDCHVTYRGEAGAVISAGLTVPKSKWQKPDTEMSGRFSPEVRDKIYMVDLTAYGLTQKDWGHLCAIGSYETSGKYDGAHHGESCDLYVGNRRMNIARYPNQGTFAHLAAIMDVGDVREFTEQNYFREWDERRNHRGGAYLIDKETNERVKKWREPEKAWMFGYFYHDWADASTPVTFDTAHRTVFPKYVAMFGARAGALYYFYNVPEELDEVGEWYLDRDNGRLYFLPDEDEESLDFAYSSVPLIDCKNARNLTLEGFTLLSTTGDAVTATGNELTFSSLTVRNIGGTAMRINGDRNLVRDCEISHTGKGGIYVSGGDRKTLVPGNCRVTGNYIHDISEVYLTYQPGISLHGVGNRCDHNEIANSPHMAIGWGGNDHLIEYNDIHDVVLQSNDAGALYSGYDWLAHGTVIRYNKLENIGGNFSPDGIYWDDGLSGQTAYGNLLIHVNKNGFLSGGGRENRIEGNVIIDAGTPISCDQRNRDGYLGYGWAHAAVENPEDGHWKKLKALPYRSEIWVKKYPLLEKLKTSFETNPDDPDFPVNPAYCSVKGNVIIDAEGRDGNYADYMSTYDAVRDNLVFNSREEAGWDGEAQCFRADSPVFEKLPGFVNIPVSEIGRKK